jgi:hypothetical protein
MGSANKPEWILLVHQLPPKPTNLRVRTWRRLQKLGAIAIKNSVYALPFNDRTYEDFQWLKQEIESSGGEAAIFRGGAVEGATDEEMIVAFKSARDEEYRQVAAELDVLAGAIRELQRRGHLSASRIKGRQPSKDELEKLNRELQGTMAIDFFEAAGRRGAVAAYERCRKALAESEGRNPSVKRNAPANSVASDLAGLQGRRWVTRKNLFIDRLAVIWLIKRFIDRRPRFSFVSEGESIEAGIRFDMYGAEFTHEGDACTFETMIGRLGLDRDPALRAIGEIVHDIDLKDNKFSRIEAPGLGKIIRGLADLLKEDRKLVEQCCPIFDGLYELIGRGEALSNNQTIEGKRSEKRTRKREGKPSGRRRRRSPGK